MIRNALHIVFLMGLLGLSAASTAQQDPKFNQYMFNPLGINPAYAGSREVLSAVSLFRNQWVGFEGAPITQTFAIHGPLIKRKMGLGFQVTNDILGPRNTINAEVDYAYRFPFLRGKLAFGLSAGLYYYAFDWNKIDYKDQGDFIPQTSVDRAFAPDFDFGTYWNNSKLYMGFELAHLTRSSILTDTGSINNPSVYRQFRHISATAGRAFVLNDALTLKPSLMYKQAGLYRGMLDVNFSVLIKQKFWAGVTARTDYGLGLIFEYVFNQKIRVGYSFDYPFNDFQVQTQGTSHELFLGIDFGAGKSSSISPRYF